jgi:hypothetical protein
MFLGQEYSIRYLAQLVIIFEKEGLALKYIQYAFGPHMH